MGTFIKLQWTMHYCNSATRLEFSCLTGCWQSESRIYYVFRRSLDRIAWPSYFTKQSILKRKETWPCTIHDVPLHPDKIGVLWFHCAQNNRAYFYESWPPINGERYRNAILQPFFWTINGHWMLAVILSAGLCYCFNALRTELSVLVCGSLVVPIWRPVIFIYEEK